MQDWYRCKPYLHFDYALPRHKAKEYALNKKCVINHAFLPLIHYSEVTRKYQKNKKTGRREFRKKKTRNLFYASHIDGYIYSYYTHLLEAKYEQFLKKYDLSDNVSAYRTVKKNGESYSNIEFAREAFHAVKEFKNCHVLCVDISKFFDKICTKTLKKKLESSMVGCRGRTVR